MIYQVVLPSYFSALSQSRWGVSLNQSNNGQEGYGPKAVGKGHQLHELKEDYDSIKLKDPLRKMQNSSI